MKKYVDRKRAASGERDDSEQIALAPVESLVAALQGPRTKQSSSNQNKTPVARSTGFVERRGVSPGTHSRNPTPIHLRELMRDIPKSEAVKSSYHIGDDRELVVEIGPTDRKNHRRMSTGEIHFWELFQDPMENPQNERVATKLHPMVYYFDMRRDELLTDTVVFEAALYSRVIGTDHKAFIGKAKVYFSRPGNERRFWINLAKIR